MAPRIQCLNAARRVVAKRSEGVISPAAQFSTSGRALADPPASSHSIPTSRSRNFPASNPNNNNTSSSPPRPNPIMPSANSSIMRLIERQQQRATAPPSPNSPISSLTAKQPTLSEQLTTNKLTTDVSRQITHQWRAGDIYAPHDLSSTEMTKWKKRGQPEIDAFDVLRMDPIEQYKNFSMMAEYVTQMGRIKHSDETGLRAKNQRRVAKAVRRLVGMGFMPAVYHHPEILAKKMRRSSRFSF